MNRIAYKKAEKKFVYYFVYRFFDNILLYVKSNNNS